MSTKLSSVRPSFALPPFIVIIFPDVVAEHSQSLPPPRSPRPPWPHSSSKEWASPSPPPTPLASHTVSDSLSLSFSSSYVFPSQNLIASSPPPQVTLHYIRSFSLDGSYYSQVPGWRTGAAAKLSQPLGSASTSDLIDLLQERLGNDSVQGITTQQPVRANAVLVMLVRNSEINDAASAIAQLEDRFNKKYNYPWVFLNDEPFDERFIQCVILPALLCGVFGIDPYVMVTLRLCTQTDKSTRFG